MSFYKSKNAVELLKNLEEKKMKKLLTAILAIAMTIGFTFSTTVHALYWSHPVTYQPLDESLSEMLKIQTPDGKQKAYCIFNFNTGAIEYFHPICDKSREFEFYIPSYINNVKVKGINDQALSDIFYDEAPMWQSYMGNTKVFVPASLTDFGDQSFYSGYITEDGYTICCEQNSPAHKAAQYGKVSLCKVTEFSMVSVADWNDYAVLMQQLTAGIPAPAKEIQVLVNDERYFIHPEPIILNDRVLLPLRGLAGVIGAMVDWDQETQTVTITRNTEIRFGHYKKDVISLKIGSNILYKNGTPIELDVPAQIINDYTMVPVRAISEAFDWRVEWDGNIPAVLIAY